MKKDHNPSQAGVEEPAPRSNDENAFFDPKAQFEVWLDMLKANLQPRGTPLASEVDNQAADFFVECGAGTNCQIRFAGALRIDGSLAGSIRSDGGTLLAGRGCIDADLEVGTACLDSFVSGDINATERVVLHARARVIGNIRAPALSIRRGAIFEGDFNFQDRTLAPQMLLKNEGANKYGDQFLAVNAVGD